MGLWRRCTRLKRVPIFSQRGARRSALLSPLQAGEGIKSGGIAMLTTRAGKLAASCILAALAAGEPSFAQQPGLTPSEIRIGTFGALTGPGYLYGKLIMN